MMQSWLHCCKPFFLGSSISGQREIPECLPILPYPLGWLERKQPLIDHGQWRPSSIQNTGGSFLGGAMEVRYICAVEQRLARQAHNLEVVGSIPTGATFYTR